MTFNKYSHLRVDSPKSVASSSATWKLGTRLTGVVPPLVTPLKDGDMLDLPGLERLVEHVVGGGVNGLFILGTTGEAVSLSAKVRRQLIEETVRLVRHRIPVLVGVTDNAVSESRALAKWAADVGADAVVLTTPFYLPLDQCELTSYVRRIVAEMPLPVFLYNMPRLTKTWFEVETVHRLLDCAQIAGLKDSSGDVDYLQRICEATNRRDDWTTLVGSENLMMQAIQLGAHGCVGGSGNVWPELLVELYQAACCHDKARINHLEKQLARLHKIFEFGQYATGSIRGLKCALEVLGICSSRMAEPFEACNEQQRREIVKILGDDSIQIDGRVRPIRAAGEGN